MIFPVAIHTGLLHRLVFAIHGILLSMRNTAIIHKEYLNLLPITIFSTLNHTESNS